MYRRPLDSAWPLLLLLVRVMDQPLADVHHITASPISILKSVICSLRCLQPPALAMAAFGIYFK